MARNQHVLPHERGWAVIADGAEAPGAVFRTQHEAWERAKALARKERAEAVLHGRNGRIRERSTYGYDPRHSRG
jgi:hypothetical protein